MPYPGEGRTDWNMKDAYEEISYENVDGGVWKQGWDIELDETRLKKKLRVFVIPHSHNDPGSTFIFIDCGITHNSVRTQDG